MDLSAFQMFKYNGRTNATERLHNTPIVGYGRITEVIDIQTVVAEAVVQTTATKETYTVTLLNISSALLEASAYPKPGDTVLLLFLQRFDPRMFMQGGVYNPYAVGYNQFSGVGVLMSTVKGLAETVVRFYESGGGPAAKLKSGAQWSSVFTSKVALMFCRAIFDGGDEQLISVTFGEGRPLMEQFLSRVAREHGFWKDNEGNLVELDAAVTERYSKYAPVTKDIQGTQTVKIGIGDDGNSTKADVDITLGGQADVKLTSKSGKAEKYDKAVSLESGGAVSFKAGAKVAVKNTSESLGAVLSDLIQAVQDLMTNPVVEGSPATVDAPSKIKLSAIKNRCEALLEK